LPCTALGGWSTSTSRSVNCPICTKSPGLEHVLGHGQLVDAGAVAAPQVADAPAAGGSRSSSACLRDTDAWFSTTSHPAERPMTIVPDVAETALRCGVAPSWRISR
jgi:hypothetical protein